MGTDAEASEAGRQLSRARWTPESRIQRAALQVIEGSDLLSPALRRAVASAVAEQEADGDE